MSGHGIKPFWRYYGGKYRTAPRYPAPIYDTIIEPFAGSAGYSLRYCHRRVILVEKYDVIAEIWRYLIRVPAAEILRIPEVDHVEDLPAWVPTPARYLVGFWMNVGSTSPRKALSAGCRMLRSRGRKIIGWTTQTKERVASQVEKIRHWQCIEGDFERAPDLEATWFVDPPYSNESGQQYVERDIDYGRLASWCRSRRGQVIVCENEGATWLPFEPFHSAHSFYGKSREAIWYRESAQSEIVVEKGTA